ACQHGFGFRQLEGRYQNLSLMPLRSKPCRAPICVRSNDMDEKLATQIAESLARIATELNQLNTMMQARREKRRKEALAFFPILTAVLIVVWQVGEGGT